MKMLRHRVGGTLNTAHTYRSALQVGHFMNHIQVFRERRDLEHVIEILRPNASNHLFHAKLLQFRQREIVNEPIVVDRLTESVIVVKCQICHSTGELWQIGYIRSRPKRQVMGANEMAILR